MSSVARCVLLAVVLLLDVCEPGRIKVKAPKYKPSAPKPPTNHKPYGWDPPARQPTATHAKPIGFEQPAHQTHGTNLGTGNNQANKPIGWNVPPQQNANQRPIGFNPPPQGTNAGGGTHYNTNQQPGTHYNTNQQPGTHWNPNQQQQPGGHWNPNQQQHGTHWNPNQQQPGGHWNPNQQQYGGHWNQNQQPGGYWNSYQHGHAGQSFPHYGGSPGGHVNYGPVTYMNGPSASPYKYSSFSAGSGALGFFLGYGLAKLTTPSFGGYGGGFNRNYDHYEVHHYYHNRDSVPPQTYVQPSNIDICAETSTALCTGNTQALCTRNGTIMCVTRAQNVVPCANNSNINCVNTTIPCVNSSIAGCEGDKNATTIMVPCVSTANIYGNITYVNNTVVLNVNPAQLNSTEGAGSANATQAPAQMFCVTVLAVPAASKPSEPQVVYDKHADFFNTFVKSAWGI